MTGSSTPTRSCLKRRLQSAKNSISGSLSSGSSTTGSNSSRTSLCKTVSFDGKDNVFFCDPDYDRHSVPVAAKLSYEDILELKMLNVNMMCPQHRCAPVVPVGIMPLLPTSDSSHSSASSSASSTPLFKPKQAPVYGSRHHNFVSLLDDEASSMSSMTPPPSSPSEHSPNMAPMPMIATDDEGQLIFSFSSPDDGIIDSVSQAMNTHSLSFATSNNSNNSRRHKVLIASSGSSADESEEDEEHVKPGVPHAVALSKKLSTIVEQKEVVKAPFPVPPSQFTAASSHLTLTPSFFTLPAPPSPSSSSASSSSPNSAIDSASPFPFAPPVPTTTGLDIQPAAAMTMTLSDSLSGQNSNSIQPGDDEKMSDASVHATNTDSPITTSPVSQALNHHQIRSTSSSTSTIVPTNSNNKQSQSPISPSSTPHASPTLLMRSSKLQMMNAGQAPPVAGPLAALQHQQPRSPQLSGLPSPSLIPPSPLSLYPPSLDLANNNNTNNTNTTPGTIPTGFFPEKKKGIASSAVMGHVKRGSGSALAKPTSPVVKPLAS